VQCKCLLILSHWLLSTYVVCFIVGYVLFSSIVCYIHCLLFEGLLNVFFFMFFSLL